MKRLPNALPGSMRRSAAWILRVPGAVAVSSGRRLVRLVRRASPRILRPAAHLAMATARHHGAFLAAGVRACLLGALYLAEVHGVPLASGELAAPSVAPFLAGFALSAVAVLYAASPWLRAVGVLLGTVHGTLAAAVHSAGPFSA